ncbi:SMI1/KNR4 family protein [Planomicrobium chinense]|uniref:SMI1/KNR4 family protein n=1 Tax=Planococcus chinensis TaxID=272917 RepID=UPI001CC4318C|nr:SMI1/KNR4 family protein [Planococcus chinensis]MBZ5201844.1 SMI1/KNR4 family protein [Planococcus chinensis]
MSKINITLEALKKRLDSKGLLEVQQEDGYVTKVKMNFNPPATESELQKLPFTVPEDYKEFLRLHNGGLIFSHPQYGSGFELFTIDEILEYRAIPGYDYPDNWFPIAYGYDGCYLIVTDKVVGNGYLYVMDTGYNFEDNMYIGMNFEDWLEKFVIAQGSKFWEWGFIIP